MPTACPPLERLVALMQGQCPASEAEPLATHIEACTQCVERLHGVQADPAADPVLQALGQAGSTERPPLPAWLGGLMSELSKLQAETSPHTGSAFLTLCPPPERLGEYRILQLLGEGGMGSVYLAEDTRLGRKVALKTMKPAHAADPAFRHRFQREARAAAAVEHDHIIPIFQVGEVDDIPFLAMPFLKGETLDERLKREKAPLPVSQAVRIAREAALGLQAAHAAGLVHRDIKPANLWLETRNDPTDFRVRLLDFGLARAAADDAHLTAPGMLLGTPAYLSPEQARSQPADARSDLFSLGCVLYQMVTARRPFTGKDTMSILTSLAVDTPAAPHALNPHCPRRLSHLVMQLLAKDPAQRPASAAAVAQALADLEATLATQSHADKRRPFLALIAALILVLVGCAALFSDSLYRIVTNQGVLIVEVDNQQIEVRVLQNGIVVHDKTTKREFSLKAGRGEIEVLEKDGIKLATKQFELTRNGKTTVKVTFEDLAATRKVKDADRLAAEWTIAVGGSVRINGQEYVLKQLSDLPNERFQLTGVDVYLKDEKRNPLVTDAGLVALQGCKHLTFVNLSYTDVSDAGLAHLQECKNLTVLSLCATKVSDAGLAHFAGCTKLELLNLDRTRISDAGLAHFQACKQLRLLHLHNVPVSDVGLAYFKDCKHLEGLNLSGTRASDAGLDYFKECRGLQTLWLGGTTVSDAGMALLKNSHQLESLYLGGTKVTDAALSVLRQCPKLRILYLHETQVTDAGLDHLKNCTALGYLYLAETGISDRGLAQLKGLHRLGYLNLYRTRVTAEGIDDLKKALPTCTIEWK